MFTGFCLWLLILFVSRPAQSLAPVWSLRSVYTFKYVSHLVLHTAVADLSQDGGDGEKKKKKKKKKESPGPDAYDSI